MNRSSHHPRPMRTKCRGLSLVEVAISIVIVGGVLTASLTTVAHSKMGLQKMGHGAMGMLLAQQLMAEILQQSYQEPVDTPVFGRETSESGGDRVEFDDVDDFDAWSSSPPEYKDGTSIPNLDGWERMVAVRWVEPNDLNRTAISDTGIKRITITVTHDGVPAAELTAIRTGAASLSFEKLKLERQI